MEDSNDINRELKMKFDQLSELDSHIENSENMQETRSVKENKLLSKILDRHNQVVAEIKNLSKKYIEGFGARRRK